jgi:Rrf2 family protein
MIFTTKAEYGVRLLVELGRHHGDGPVSLKAIAEAEGLPLAYLERIVALLKKAELVESTRGPTAGYRLARDPAPSTWTRSSSPWRASSPPMSCFVDDMQEGRVLCSHVADDRGACATRLLWLRVHGGVMEKLSETTPRRARRLRRRPAASSPHIPPPS